MSMEDTAKLISQLTGYAGTQSDLDYMLRGGRNASVRHGGDALAATEYSTVFKKLAKQINVTMLTLIPEGALTADATDFATISLGYADGAAGAVTKVASITTELVAGGGTGDWVAETAIAFDLAGVNTVIAAGKYLVLEVEKAGIGVDCPAYTLDVDYELV